MWFFLYFVLLRIMQFFIPLVMIKLVWLKILTNYFLLITFRFNCFFFILVSWSFINFNFIIKGLSFRHFERKQSKAFTEDICIYKYLEIKKMFNEFLKIFKNNPYQSKNKIISFQPYPIIDFMGGREIYCLKSILSVFSPIDVQN